MRRVLLLDPDVARRDRMCHGLTEKGLLVIGIGDRDGLASIDLSGIDVVVSKVDLPSGPAMRLRDRLGGLPLILFTEDANLRRAVEAMQQGASDYLVLPFDADELITAINRSFERAASMRSDDRSQPAMAVMVGHCPAMLDLFQRIQTLAEAPGSLLIQGESGSGKELVARAVHAASRRRSRPLISLNCATIPTSLIEAELFGDRAGSDHRRGLVEAADEGTLFLDEISALTLEAQARLLQLLQDDTRNAARTGNGSNVDVRVIAATHRDLRPLVEAGRFLEPLYVRLNATTLTVPPLRERGDDIVELANWLLRRICHKLSKPEISLSDCRAGRDWSIRLARQRQRTRERTGTRGHPVRRQPSSRPSCSRSITPMRRSIVAIESGRDRDRDQSRGLLRQVRARASGRADRDGTREQTRHQPQESLGTPSATEYSAQAHRHPSTATRQRT